MGLLLVLLLLAFDSLVRDKVVFDVWKSECCFGGLR